MGKRKAKETGDNAGNVASDGNAEKANASGTGEYVRYCREQIKAFIQKLKTDCAYICDTVRESLYDDGRGLLDDENLRKRLGTVAYIDNFYRHFGACLDFTDVQFFTSDMLSDRLYTACGITDMRELERLPQRDDKLLKDITDAGDDETWARNMTAYIFALWVNYHVAPVVAAFRKWLEITGENAPAILRDYNALARCVCVFTLTEDNTTGGFFYDGGWFETFAICGIKRNGKAGDRSADAASRHETATGADGGGTLINAERVEIRAAKIITPEAKAKHAGHDKGFSQNDFAALLKHADGTAYGTRTIKLWDASPEKRPIAGGVRYSPDLRRDIIAARKWANDFNDEKRAAANARRANLGHYATRRQ